MCQNGSRTWPKGRVPTMEEESGDEGVPGTGSPVIQMCVVVRCCLWLPATNTTSGSFVLDVFLWAVQRLFFAQQPTMYSNIFSSGTQAICVC